MHDFLHIYCVQEYTTYIQLKIPRLLPKYLIVTAYLLKVCFSIIRYEVFYYYVYAYTASGCIDTGATFLGSKIRAAF